MDNNMISIDNLVKQRLSGAEEHERSGAWMRMAELLDKEEKRRPIGFFWRSGFGAVGIILLMVLLAGGTYEFTNSFRNLRTGTAEVAAVTATLNAPEPAAASNSASGTPSAASTKKQATDRKMASTSATKKNAGSVSPKGNYNKSGVAVTATLANNATTASRSERKHDAMNTAAPIRSNPASVTGTSHTTTDVAADQPAFNNNPSAAPANATAAISKQESENGNQPDNTSVASAPYKNSQPAATSASTSTTSVKATEGTKPVSLTNAKPVPNATPKVTPAHTTTDIAQLPLASATSTGAASSGRTAQKMGTAKTIITKQAKSTPATTTQPMAVAASAPVVTRQTIHQINMQQKATGVYPGRYSVHNDTISADDITVERKHNAANATAEIDEQATEVSEMAISSSGPSASEKSATANKKPASVQKPTRNNTPGLASRGATSLARVGVIKPATPASVNMLPPIVWSANGAALKFAATDNANNNGGNGLIADKKKGSFFFQNLVAAFNDIKYKVGTAQFSPGLTGGINGTFFGPNSCKGFQFGVTANFELDEKWNFMAELKYFNRINNTFFMHVQYDRYDTNATFGGFNKTPKEVDYTFSTIHSFELPMTLRYGAGKMNFFGGMNFSYSLPVNISITETNLYPNNPTSKVTQVGSNDKPSLTPEDFGARFGMAYTVGATYKIAPNMSLDFRNVQTFWDNAKGSAAKNVSNQLFKSPSLQLSFFYRFGLKDEDNSK